MLVAQASVRYFGESSTADAVAGWLLLAAIAVGAIGAVATIKQRGASGVQAAEDR